MESVSVQANAAPRRPAKKYSEFRDIVRRFRKNKSAMAGLVLLVIILAMAIFADLIVPYQQAILQNGKIRLQPSSAAHLFGTDEFGRDLFARIVHGSRYSLLIGIVSSLLALIASVVLGAAAGYFGGRTDTWIMRVMEILSCVPPVLLALSIVAALGPSLQNLLIAITVSCIPYMVRLVRSVVLSVADLEYIEAARSYGAGNIRVIARYVVPNAIGPIIVSTTMNISSMILSAAGLSFIGMGVQPPAPEWGALLASARTYMFKAPYLLYYPGVFILAAALCFNLVGDGLRDALDPKLRD